MEPISSLTLAWSLFGNITLGVGVNELHRQMVNRLGNRDIASLSLQKALHRSLLDAVDTLARSFADPAHPTFRAIPDPATRREEQERIKNLMQRIRARFPETGSLHRPVDLLLHDAPHKDTRQRLRELGLEADLAELPPAMYDSFHANLSLLMLAHFRHKLATDSGLGTLLQLDMTVGVGRELAALSAFLQERFGSDLPEQIRPLFDDLTSDLKAYLAQELADLRQELREVKSLLQLPDSDIFCVLTSESGSRHVERYLAHKAGGRLYLEPQTVEAFTEKIGRNGSLLIRGLPGTGKTLTGLALAESLRYRQQPYTIFYINLRYRLEENDLIEGVKRRLTQPALFFFDDCQGQYDLADNLRRRLKRVFRQSQVRGLLLFAARATPTPAGAPRGDESDFEADLTENEAVLEFHPTLQFFRHVITLIKPHFAGLSKERLTRVFEFTGRDLFLLDQLMDVLERPVDIDQLTPATLYAKTMQRYFGSSTVYRPAFLKLAALAQFDLAPPAPFLERDLSHEDVQAAEELVVLAGRPPCYYFLHASAAELIFRALVWNAGQEAETVAIAGDHLLAYFRDERLDDRQRTAALLNVMQNRLRLQQSESEEPAIKSRFLANGEVLAFIERAFAGLPLNTIAAGLSILREQNDNAFVPYYALLRRQVETGLVLRQTLQQPFGQTGFFLRQAKAHYPELIASLRRQMRPGDLPSLLSKTGLQNFLLLLSNLAQTDDPWWQETLAALNEQMLDRLIDQTLAASHPIGTLALRQLAQTDPDLLRALEAKIGAPRYLRLITSAGTVVELFKIIEHSSPAMRAGLIAALDDRLLDRLLEQTLASGRSIGTLDLALRELGRTDPALRRALEAKIGAPRYLRLITSAGTVYELFMIIQHSSPAMRAGLIAALDDQTLDRLLDQTLASGRSIGTLHLALRALGQTDPNLLHALEAKIGAQRYLRLITSAGTVFELFKIIEHSSPAMRTGLIAALDDQTLDRLLDQTLASGRSIGTLHLALRELGRTDPALLRTLEAKIGAHRWWRLILALGRIRVLTHILECMSWQFRQDMVQAGSNFSAPEWQLFLSRSNFLSICGFVRWYANFADVLFTPAFCQAHQPTFETLISQASHEALIRGARILKSAPDSAGKQYLVQRLVSHLASLELSAPTFETFNEAANTIGLLWEYLPAQRARLVRSLLSHLPPEDRWAEDEQFVRAVRVLFHILADPAAPQDIARRLLRAGNGPTVAALLAQATTLDIFLYLWNLYVLWYQLHSQADQAFAAFLDATIQDTVAKEAASRFGLDDQDIDVHIMLIGFLHFIGLAPDSIDKHHWQGTLPPPGELIKRVSQKPFIPAVFFLLGLEWLYEQPIRYYVWEWIVPKAEAYGERTAALDHINQLAMSRTKG